MIKPNNSEMIDKLLEALKGLSFNIEIKITDIRKKDDESSEESSEELPPEQPQEKPQVKLTAKPEVKLPAKPQSMPEVKFSAKPEVIVSPKPQAKSEVVPEPVPVPKPVSKPEVAPISQPGVIPNPNLIPQVVPREQPAEKTKQQPEEKASPINFKLSSIEETKELTPDIVGSGIPLGTIMETLVTNTDMQSSPPMAWVARDFEQLQEMVGVIDAVTPALDSMLPQSFKIGDFVFAKSIDDQSWYRAKVEDNSPDGVKVFYYDWGIRENITSDRIRLFTIPDLSLSRFPPLAAKIQIVDPSEDKIQGALTTEELVKFKFESYNKEGGYYCVSLV